MIRLVFLFFTLVTPVTSPVSGGRALEFRFLTGLVPDQGWIEAVGIPFRPEDRTFTEVTYSEGEDRVFRVLSSGGTAGLHPSVGSAASGDGYAGFLAVSGAFLAVCDYQGFSVSSSWKGVTADYREETGLMGEYRSESLLLAGGSEAFTAGFSPELTENLRLGPAWSRDGDGGYLGILGKLLLGGFQAESGVAATGDAVVQRTHATCSAAGLTARACYDGEELYGTFGPEPLIQVEWPCWGVSSALAAGSSILCLSHSQTGRFQGEFQMVVKGVSGGLTLSRNHGGGFIAGFTLGIAR